MNTIREFYEKLHATQYKPGKLSFRGDLRGQYIKKMLGGGKRVLDIGIRTGEVAAFYAASNEVVGLDFDKKCLKIAKNKLQIETVVHDISCPLPFKAAHFDAVVMAEIIEHLFMPKLAIEEAFRVLKKGGLLIGTTPNAMYWKTRVKYFLGRFDDFIFSEEHIRPWSADKLSRILKEVGFQEVRVISHMRTAWLPHKLLGHMVGRGLLFSGVKA